jgi:ElaB/YqjD/DUF883 family membrane-anchored ribosome-binding protein
MSTSARDTAGNGSGTDTDKLTDQMDEAASLARDAANESINTIRKRASELYRAGADKAVALKDCTADFVRENPVKTVLLAAGVGALVGFLLTRSASTSR